MFAVLYLFASLRFLTKLNKKKLLGNFEWANDLKNMCLIKLKITGEMFVVVVVEENKRLKRLKFRRKVVYFFWKLT